MVRVVVVLLLLGLMFASPASADSSVVHAQSSGDSGDWCLPGVFTAPEMCLPPLAMLLFGVEIWLFLLTWPAFLLFGAIGYFSEK